MDEFVSGCKCNLLLVCRLLFTFSSRGDSVDSG